MNVQFDTLGRRKRNRPCSTGKRISPQRRDLLWFQKLHEHGPLPASFLHAFSHKICRSRKRALDRMTDLYNEDRTPDSGRYLDRPYQQFDTYDSRYKELVYTLNEPAIRALKRFNQWEEHAGANTGPWRHQFMVSCITASIELATFERSDVNFIPQHMILERAETDLRFKTVIQLENSKKGREVDLIPDALFGLEYVDGTHKSYRFFLIEADRGTEPSRASRFNRKSHLRNFLQYREYIGQKLYKSHLDLTAGLLVLHVTKDQKTIDRMLTLGDELYERGNTYMLFQSAEAFAGNFAPPKPMQQFLERPWQRIGYKDFRIDQT